MATLAHARMVDEKRRNMERRKSLFARERRAFERFNRETQQINEQLAKINQEAAGRHDQSSDHESKLKAYAADAAAAEAEYQRSKESRPVLPPRRL